MSRQFSSLACLHPLLRTPMRIITTLAGDAGGTILTAVHEGLPESVSAEDNELGWRQSLAKLAQLLNTSTA
ncbi:MAG: SRPBCC domain-containing protein [Gemmatimonadaceae bacterium]|nr:SRPBCC domain-containing protein [Gemmatimonadaceae bacterium]